VTKTKEETGSNKSNNIHSKELHCHNNKHQKQHKPTSSDKSSCCNQWTQEWQQSVATKVTDSDKMMAIN